MNGTNELAADENDADLFEDWFEQGELVSDAAPYEEMSDRRSRVGVVIAAVSATALALVIVFVVHV